MGSESAAASWVPPSRCADTKLNQPFCYFKKSYSWHNPFRHRDDSFYFLRPEDRAAKWRSSRGDAPCLRHRISTRWIAKVALSDRTVWDRIKMHVRSGWMGFGTWTGRLEFQSIIGYLRRCYGPMHMHILDLDVRWPHDAPRHLPFPRFNSRFHLRLH